MKPRHPGKTRKLIVDPLPWEVLHTLVSGLPGPMNETDAERATRFDAQMAKVVSYNPRNGPEAMVAVQCVIMRLMAEDCHRDAARPDIALSLKNAHLRTARECEKLLADQKRLLAQWQRSPLRKIEPTAVANLGLAQSLIPDPDDPDFAEEAYSAIIVPLHPAPKMLQ